jgi:hypothetical protein
VRESTATDQSEGGHGWAGDYQVDIHGGIEWLEKNVAAKK